MFPSTIVDLLQLPVSMFQPQSTTYSPPTLNIKIKKGEGSGAVYTIVIYFTISITDGHACIISAGEDGFIPVHFVSGSTVRLTGKS